MEPISIIAIISTVYAAASEIIGLNPKWKSNSVVQATMSTIGKVLGLFKLVK